MLNWFRRLLNRGRRAPAGENVRDALEGHLRFKQQFAENKLFYKRLAHEKQHPRLLWIGCSDSRVAPDVITSADLGELFVVRNVANVAPPARSGDSSVGAALEYAVKHLGVEDIVVCGHSNCGGVKALMNPEGGKAPGRGSHLDRWIEFLRPAKTRAACAGPCDEARLEAASKANVLVQADNVLTYPCVREAYDTGALRVHAWYYDMEEGDLYAADEDGEFRLLTETEDA